MNSEDLAVAEQELLWRVQSVTGLMEEKHEQLEGLGVYSDYAKVYEAYAELISLKEQDLEALKRAVFLSWYEVVEPACFSGLLNLPEQTTQILYAALERKVKTNALDLEMKWMLPFYNAVCDIPFSLYPQLSNLHSFLSAANPDLWRREIKPNDLCLRGQMGEYWLTIENEATTSYLNAS